MFPDGIWQAEIDFPCYCNFSYLTWHRHRSKVLRLVTKFAICNVRMLVDNRPIDTHTCYTCKIVVKLSLNIKQSYSEYKIVTSKRLQRNRFREIKLDPFASKNYRAIYNFWSKESIVFQRYRNCNCNMQIFEIYTQRDSICSRISQ